MSVLVGTFCFGVMVMAMHKTAAKCMLFWDKREAKFRHCAEKIDALHKQRKKAGTKSKGITKYLR